MVTVIKIQIFLCAQQADIFTSFPCANSHSTIMIYALETESEIAVGSVASHNPQLNVYFYRVPLASAFSAN
jgi:hypothetical protein